MSFVRWNQKRSFRDAKANEWKVGHVYDKFLEYGETLARNLKQGSICRAYGSPFDSEESWRKWPPEMDRENIEHRPTRHVHLFSQLNDREIGRKRYGQRTIYSTLISSECREFRYDQTFYARSKRPRLRWANRRLVHKWASQVVPYDTPFDFMNFESDWPEGRVPRRSYDRDNIRGLLIVEPTSVHCGAQSSKDKYVLVIREIDFKNYLEVFSYSDPTNSKKLRKYKLPDAFDFLEMSWKSDNKSLCILGKCRNGEKKRCEHLVLVFDAFPFNFNTGFIIDSFSVPPCFSPIKIIYLNDDVIYALTNNEAILYSYNDVWVKHGSIQVSHDDLYWPIRNELEPLPQYFEVTDLGAPLAAFPGHFQTIQCNPTFPFFIGLDVDIDSPIKFMDLVHPTTSIDFNEHLLPYHPNSLNAVEFDLYEETSQFPSAIIFPEYVGVHASTFFTYEKCYLVMYNVRTVKREDGSYQSKIFEMWRTLIFPEVDDRNKYRRQLLSAIFFPLYVERNLRDYIKVCDTMVDNDNQHLIISMTIDVAKVTSYGYFETASYANEVACQFVYILDMKYGQILRIVPLFGLFSLESAVLSDAITIEEDLIVLTNSSSEFPKLEVWEMTEPQQYVYQTKELQPRQQNQRSYLGLISFHDAVDLNSSYDEGP